MKPLLSEAEIDCLRSLLKAAAELDVPIIAVGATARWLVFNLPNGIPLHRTTTDWDFGVRVADWTVFQKLRQRLLEQPDPFSEGRHQHELNHKASGIRMDLLPFGGLENDGRIRWPDTAFEMTVFGFSDALANAIQVELSPDLRLPVASVPLLVALKFFAFADRKSVTDRDLSDLWHVIQNYVVTGRESELFDPPLSAVVDEQFDWGHAGSLLLGYDVGRASRAITAEQLIPILQGLTDPYAKDIAPLISRRWSAEDEESERQRVSASFFWLLKGLQAARGNLR
jgi:predicted nucleotidyltransferase